MDEYEQEQADREQYWAEMQRLQSERAALSDEPKEEAE